MTTAAASAQEQPKATGVKSTHVEVLTAEVRALMVGSRQITLSVYRQLDTVPPERIEPFGRVRDGHDTGLWVIGRDKTDGALVRAQQEHVPNNELIWMPTFPFIEIGRVTYERLPKVRSGNAIEHDRYVTYQVDGEPAYLYAGTKYDGSQWVTFSKDDLDEPARLLIEWDSLVRNVRIERLAHATRLTRYLAWKVLPLIVLAGLR